MREIPSAPEVAIVSGDFASLEPETLFNFLTLPEHLVEWWPEVATVDLRVGGEYRFEWPTMGWILTGVYTSLEPGKSLGFTWNWNHEPGKKSRQVDVHLMPIEDGTRVAFYHREFGEDELETADRQGILEGWIHFGMKLSGLRAGRGT